MDAQARGKRDEANPSDPHPSPLEIFNLPAKKETVLQSNVIGSKQPFWKVVISNTYLFRNKFLHYLHAAIKKLTSISFFCLITDHN